jgi:hypothetical protein
LFIHKRQGAEIFFSKKISQMKAGQSNKYDVADLTKIWSKQWSSLHSKKKMPIYLIKIWINLYDLDLNCSSKFEPASKLAIGDGGKEARLLAQELRPVLTFLAARVNERHLRLSLFFFE